MATKKTKRTTSSRSTSSGGIIRACTYFALVIAAAIFLFNGIVRALDIGVLTSLASVLSLIGQILLVIGIGFPAYDYTAGKSKTWRIIFWVALVVYVFGCVFGVIRF
ncbi:MAG: hypothetical protein IJX91_05320 [Clostridia bacterium]|nr:hypothetical protein [Clostridia bacterium]